MKNNILVISGSARKQGDTERFVKFLCTNEKHTFTGLYDYTIAPYNYNGSYSDNDAFTGLVHIMHSHNIIVLATPVYWYAMSGLMKNFFDRLTDLVTIQKQSGRNLKGKELVVVATGSDAVLPEGFEIPFKKTAGYFNMQYKGIVYHSVKKPDYNINDRAFFKKMLG